ncbi:MAG: hypothetical protein AB1589_39375 [Cyanobacteriota bacterium]
MAYTDFTLRRAKQDLKLTFIEGRRFLPETTAIAPSSYLTEFLQESLPLAIAMGSEKARLDLIISPILFEVRKILNHQVSFFSGEDFTVAPEVGLSGVCDFMISRSPEQLLIEAPAVVIVEAKKGNLKESLGKCMAAMVAAQRFNQEMEQEISPIYGSVTSGNLWSFLKLEGQTVTVDLTEYLIPPVDQLLGMLVWMVKE